MSVRASRSGVSSHRAKLAPDEQRSERRFPGRGPLPPSSTRRPRGPRNRSLLRHRRGRGTRAHPRRDRRLWLDPARLALPCSWLRSLAAGRWRMRLRRRCRSAGVRPSEAQPPLKRGNAPGQLSQQRFDRIGAPTREDSSSSTQPLLIESDRREPQRLGEVVPRMAGGAVGPAPAGMDRCRRCSAARGRALARRAASRYDFGCQPFRRDGPRAPAVPPVGARFFRVSCRNRSLDAAALTPVDGARSSAGHGGAVRFGCFLRACSEV